VGQLPLKLYRREQEDGRTVGKRPDPKHPLYFLLHDMANDELTSMQFREMVTRHLAIWGRAYAHIQRNGRGDVTGLWPLHPARMFVERDSLNRKRFRYWMGRADYQEFVHNPLRPEILHLHINSDDGLDGRSPLAINRESLGITKAAEDYVGAWFKNGAVPGVVATHPGRLTKQAKESIRESWLHRFMGARSANKFAILEEGIALTVVGVDPQKSQLTELRNAQIEAAARIYRVPLFMIQNASKDTTWGSGIESQMLGFVNITLMPWFQQWTQAIARDLLTRQSFNSHTAIFVVNALVRGDIKTRYEAYASGRQNGWLNGDEIRELEDLNPIDGGAGELFWMPANMLSATASAIVEEPEPTTPAPEGVM
jgi:HK97 family phage portal protein